VIDRVLLLTPSRGLGGGIERYSETLEWAFTEEGIECRRIDLSRAGPLGHARMFADAVKRLRSSTGRTRLVLAHPSLLPVAVALAEVRPVRGISVVCHGCEVWGTRRRLRQYIEQHLMSRPAVRVVAASSFTSGVLSACSPATILPPGLSPAWFETLVKASADEAMRDPGIDLITAFRLADWRDKGLPELLEAVEAVGRPDVRLTVCGSGEPSRELAGLVERYERCVIRPGLTDSELACELARSDLFVLATRTRRGRSPCGEGFGLVLLEAQVAGTPVVGPSFGGSHDAYVDRLTGVTPTDESVAALAKVLDEVLGDPRELAEMGRVAGRWARDCFAPKRYARRAVARLL
jgi:phosphatidylinositol alpha-1,6-mannosyltransferase